MRPTLSWTPTGDLRPGTTDPEPVAAALRAGGVLVLSGAGLSTESGIPDYRGEGGSLRRHTPMTYQEFTADARARRRYWARSQAGARSAAPGPTPGTGPWRPSHGTASSPG